MAVDTAEIKKEEQAIREYKNKQLATAVKNVLVNLRNMGLTNSKVKIDESDHTAYIAVNINDISELLARNCRKSVKKACGDLVEVVSIVEDSYIVIRVRRR